MNLSLKPVLLLFFAVVFLSHFETKAQEALILTSLTELHPTQSNVGMLEVQRKVKKLQAVPEAEYDQYLRDNAIPVVKGPNNKFYLIDHHHLGRALHETGATVAYVFVIENMSQLSVEKFWKKMTQKQWVYLRDEKDRVLLPEQLPQNIIDLKDDPYRSLAGRVRRLGGYLKVAKPFAEFEWASFFRKNKLLKGLKTFSDIEKAIPQALVISRSVEAKELPGFQIVQCKSVFK